jgi:putative lipoic acid-binding regulatory protein
MNAPDNAAEQVKFPVVVHFKIIGEVSEDLRTHLEIALWELRIAETLHPGRLSAGGKYMTFNLSMTVHSAESLREIDARLRAVTGVKMVL